MKIPKGSMAGSKFRLKGRGLPGKPPGDQYVVLRIVTPPARTQAAEALYRKMAQELAFNPRANMGV
jgi:curved DNA-binding protein